MPNLKTVGIFKKKNTCNFEHVGFGVHRVKNTQFHQVISITSNYKQ